MCARPQCDNLKDSRPWCPVCEKHIDSTEDPDHQHHRGSVTEIELIGGPYDGRRFMLSTDEHHFPIALALRLPSPNVGPSTLQYECEQVLEMPAVGPWLYRLVT